MKTFSNIGLFLNLLLLIVLVVAVVRAQSDTSDDVSIVEKIVEEDGKGNYRFR